MAIKVLVPISGGKDSQACLKLALQNYSTDQVRGLFCDTQFEHPITYTHVNRLSDLYGVRIDTVCDGSVEAQCMKHKRFPSGVARFCTEELKIWPTKRYCKALAEEQGGFEVWYGMRLEESPDRKKRYAGKVCDELYAPHEVLPGKYPKYLQKMGVMFRLAIVDWSKKDVLAYLNGEQNPLYAEGFDRVGCFPCQAAGDAHKEKCYAFDDFGAQQKRKVWWLSKALDKPMFTSKGGQERNKDVPMDLFEGCGICAI